MGGTAPSNLLEEERIMDTLKKMMLGTVACLLVLTAAGCNTFKGMGKDIQKGGEAVEGAAEEVETEIKN